MPFSRRVGQFYGPTLPLFNLKEGLCTSFYPAHVVSDLNGRLENKATETSKADVQRFSQAVGWNLQRDLRARRALWGTQLQARITNIKKRMKAVSPMATR